MTTTTTTLVDFLTARLDEDEAAARAAARVPDRVKVPADVRIGSNLPLVDGRWGWGEGRVSVPKAWDVNEPTASRYDVAVVPRDHDAARHIARHDPARVLREVEAKRRVVARCAKACEDQGNYMEDGQEDLAMDTLRALASVYSDHPDYDPAWA